MLVVLEPDVKERLVPLDQLGFEVQRFLLGAREHVVEVVDRLGEGASLTLHAERRAEVRPDAVAQVRRLADVDHLTLGVAHEIDAGAGRQAGELVGEAC